MGPGSPQCSFIPAGRYGCLTAVTHRSKPVQNPQPLVRNPSKNQSWFVLNRITLTLVLNHEPSPTAYRPPPACPMRMGGTEHISLPACP